VIPEIWRVAWYRFRLDLPRRWTSYVGIIVLVTLVGGLSLGSIAGARRSASAFPTFLKSTNPSDLAIDVGRYNPKILQQIAHLPQVTSLETYVSPNAAPVTKSGHVDTHSPLFTSNFDPIASLNGLYFDQDRITIVHGTRPDPRRPDEAMVNEFAAKMYKWHVGSVVRFGFFSNAQLGQSGFPTSPAARVVNVRITGIGVANTEVVQDQIDTFPTMILTPALARPLVSCCITYAWSGLTLRRGAADVPAVESGYLHLLPPGDPYYFHVTSVIENEAQQAVKPEAIALAVFGLIAGLATVLIAIQLMGRLILVTSDEREVMWYVGARPWNTATDSMLGIAISLVLGAAGAAVVAVALSPLLVLGPLQSVVPPSGFTVDWTVLGLGALTLVVVLGAVAAALNFRGALGLRAARRANRPLPVRHITRAAVGVDVPITTVLGLRFALEGGHGRTSVPVRSSILASSLAIIVVVGTLTFGNSLNTLIGTPRLYGWNWSAMLESDAGYGNVPQTQAARLLNDNHSVTGWSGIDFDSLLFDGKAVPVVAGNTRARIAPALLSGHEVDAPDQVVLGPETLSDLHKRLGDTVRASNGSRSSVLHIVGVATMPTVGIGFGLHLSIGWGAFVDKSLIPPSVPALLGLTDPGPNAILVRFAPSVSAATAQRSLAAMVKSLNRLESGSAGILSFTDIRPAEITDYQAIGAAPLILAVGLSAGAVVALTLTLLTSARRRRRDLALLKALGFTRGQLSAVVAWQSTVTVAIGVCIGVPLGIVFGHAMWDLFAHELFAIPDATVPLLATGLVALGALVLANVVAAIPGRRAANTPSNLILNSE
jgi:FtsX-like permease family